MAKLTCILFFLGLIVTDSIGQVFPGRYREAIFQNVNEVSEVLFASNVPRANPGGGIYEFITQLPVNANEFDTTHINLYMDIFQPQGDTLEERPLVIICFGGGFVTGSKDHWSIRLLAQEMARQGYVTATIDYRLGMNLFDEELSKRAVYRAIQDGRSAVRFFKANASNGNTYRVDTSNIFMGGHSAGAFIALHNIYADREVERPEITFETVIDNDTLYDQGCLDCIGGNSQFNGRVKSVFSLAGAVDTLILLESDEDPDLVMFHSTEDGTVPYGEGMPFMDISPLIAGSELPHVHGSSLIHLRADTLGIPNQFYSYTGRGHSVHENGDTLHSDIIPGITDWFYNQHLKSEPLEILGDDLFCVGEEMIGEYFCINNNAQFPYWYIEGGELITGNLDDTTIVVLWDEGSATKSISLVTYNTLGAASDTIVKNIDILAISTNTWVGVSASWTNAANWSSGFIPNKCQEVLVPASENVFELTIPAFTQVQIQKLELGQNISLTAEMGVYLNVKQH